MRIILLLLMNYTCRFILTVAKNYRPVPYHSWLHAFWVAQSMYAAINSHLPLFPEIEVNFHD